MKGKKLKRFEFAGTVTKPICINCKHMDYEYCRYFNKKRNTDDILERIISSNCEGFKQKNNSE